MAPTSTEDTKQTSSSSLRSGILDHSADSKPWSPASIIDSLAPQVKPQSHTASPIPFFHLLERLKTTKREGWRRFGINHGESVSDHMYRMSIITMLAPPSLSSRLNVPRCTQMALVHDMAESLVGDITPIDGVPKSEKTRREGAAIDYLCNELLGHVDGGRQGRELKDLWCEYEDSATLESRFVHDVDKVELVLQMLDYERSHEGNLDLGEFSWVAKRIELPEVKDWCLQILGERANFWKSIGKIPRGHAMSEKQDDLRKMYYGQGEANGP